MRLYCVGGGPAGLYFSILTKLSNPSHLVTVLERNPPGVTYGWGVVLWEDLVDSLTQHDPESAREIARSAVSWDQQDIFHRGQQATYVGRSGYSIGRERLLDILTRRAQRLGVDIQFRRELKDLSELADADLVIASDGANSRVRQLHGNRFQTHVVVGGNKYIWLGTDKVFDAFTFAFERTQAGWIWFHAYRFSKETSTCIVECTEQTWAGLGFDTLEPDQALRRLEDIFRRPLEGHSLMNRSFACGKTPWLNFKLVTNGRWYHDKVVLMGDAAHTAHFSIGSGTRLALQDAISLAGKLRQNTLLEAALKSYQEERQAALLPIQNAARVSAEWFENIPSHAEQLTPRFAYSLVYRRGSSLWSYPLYLASQNLALRGLVRSLHSARRWALKGRRASAESHPSGP